ncbi:helix-turn-helix domain-containing protein [Parabacteroides sp. FAFU027]|uniref:helix-turn-helix domain-containing protein n=1 Tax=Parabacteroides sp. FAFU027 TaxID=2922715 RepID=UPI001FAF3872|nr:helix-turn-helix domain-containing protein [Parabacteroides sp. FAFU027]
MKSINLNDHLLELVLLKLNQYEQKIDYLTAYIDRMQDAYPIADWVYCLEEALYYLKMSPNTFRKKERMGLITCIRDGRRIFVRQSDIDRYWQRKNDLDSFSPD